MKSKSVKPGWAETHWKSQKQVNEWYESITVNPNDVDPSKLPPIENFPKNRNVRTVEVNDIDLLKEYRKKTRFYPMRSPAGSPKRFDKTDNWRALTDVECVQARLEHMELTIEELAARYNVSPYTMTRAIKGYTYKHLNRIAKPWK